MRIIILPIALLWLLALPAIAQDYQTFQSNDIHYFKEPLSGNMLASEIVSFEMSGEDSVFYPFRSLRYHESDFLTDSAGWMGEKIIIQENGVNIFFNSFKDSIFIDTYANEGEEFTVYTYESGNTIDALVTSVNEIEILGSTDSVKTYILSSSEAGFEFHDYTFRIGKQSGLLDIFPFFSFPNAYEPLHAYTSENGRYNLVGQLYPRLGITKPTRFDINNLEVGDVINFLDYYDYGHDETIRQTVLSKELMGGDNVSYEIGIYSEYYYYGTSDLDPAYTIYSDTIITETYSISDNFRTAYLIPEKDYGSGEEDLTISLNYQEECGYFERKIKNGYLPFLIDDIVVFDNWHQPQRSWSYYSAGLDNGYHHYNHIDPDGNTRYGISLKGRKNTFCNQGEFLSTQTSSKTNTLELYPNPSTSHLIIDCIGPFSYQIFSTSGQLTLNGYSSEGTTTLKTSELENGIYILRVNSSNGAIIKKFVKQ